MNDGTAPTEDGCKACRSNGCVLHGLLPSNRTLNYFHAFVKNSITPSDQSTIFMQAASSSGALISALQFMGIQAAIVLPNVGY
jgi:hypothetical protein